MGPLRNEFSMFLDEDCEGCCSTLSGMPVCELLLGKTAANWPVVLV